MKKVTWHSFLRGIFIAPLLTASLLQAQQIYTGITAIPASGQQPKYGYLTIGGGVPAHARAAFDLCFGRGITASIFGQLVMRNSPNTPSDYKPGLVAIGEAHGEVPEYLTTVAVTAGKMIPLSHKVRLNVKAGVGYIRLNSPENFVPVPKDILNFGSNYTFQRQTQPGWGLLIHPSFEVPFSRYVGVAFSPFVNYNKLSSVLGVELALQFGYLRD